MSVAAVANGHAKPQHTKRSDALGIWYDVTLSSVRADSPDLTARQTAILLTVYLTPAPHTVRSLAAHLRVTKAVITRALDTLGAHGFIDRARDPRDRRSVLIQRTGRGSSFLTAFADSIRDSSKSRLGTTPPMAASTQSQRPPVTLSVTNLRDAHIA